MQGLPQDEKATTDKLFIVSNGKFSSSCPYQDEHFLAVGHVKGNSESQVSFVLL